MKSIPSFRCRLTRNSGMALVLVLAMLVLVTGLVVAVFQSVRTESASSTAYERGTSTRMLADTAVNLVIGQIQEATLRPGEAWVSQPGLIRTFGTNGNPVKAYKLYSAPSLSIDGPFDPAAGDDLPPNATAWQTRGNEWVDLNQPIVTTQTKANGELIKSFVYPIADPRALNEVEGFSYKAVGGGNATTPADSAWKSPDPENAEGLLTTSLAMPVRWLYLLQDGKLVPGEPVGAGDAVSIAGMTAENPAIARLAFWTDDESAKVNINTAGGGTFYDVPPASTSPKAGMEKNYNSMPGYKPDPLADPFEFDIVYFQGAQGEFQRYPGHPMTTSLSSVLFQPIKRQLIASGALPAGASDSDAYVAVNEAIYELSPRIRGGVGTSFGGTVRPSVGSSLPWATDRLYASLDEIIFKKDLTNNKRNENPIDVEASRRSLVEQSKFFLTTSSRVPETTLFNTPRVALWPIPELENKRTALDRLVAFCSTIKDPSGPKKPYHFIRKNPFSPTEDFLLTNPETGTQRNLELYQYLRNLTTRTIPGFGGSFADKFEADRDQVLTQIVDFVRIINLRDNSTGNLANAYSPNGGDRRGMVVPLIPPAGGPGGGTKGFGRFPTLSELGIGIIGLRTEQERTTGVADDTQTEIQLALFPELFTPAQGYPFAAINMRMEFENLTSIILDGKQVFSQPTAVIRMEKTPSGTDEQALGGPQGFFSYIEKEASSIMTKDEKSYPAGNIMVSGRWEDNTTIQLSSASIGVKIYAVDPTSNPPEEHLVQEGAFSISQTTLRIPQKQGRFTVDAGKPTYPPFDFLRFESGQNFQVGVNPDGSPKFENRNYGGRLGGRGPKFFDKDWIRSIAPVPVANDARLLAASKNLTGLFGAHPQWNEGNNGPKHSLTRGREQWDFQPTGRYDKMLGWNSKNDVDRNNAAYEVTHYSKPDTLPPSPGGTYQGVRNIMGQSGDWSNGLGLTADGPLIGKPDEGETPSKDSNKIPYIGQAWEYQSFVDQASTYFSPNQMVPSPVVLGSLPTGVKRKQPWQTLLFRPAKSYLPGGANHPGSNSTGPADHLMLDLFWMPVVEPYAISEPFSTAGKLNLNYQIAPFNYIKRSTGLHAVMRSVLLTAMDPNEKVSWSGATNRNFVAGYKNGGWLSPTISIRRHINIPATLAYFEDRFSENKPFISESEICSIPLVPKDSTVSLSETSDLASREAGLSSFWQNRIKLTGDNSLERPYALIYPRVTTKSNTFTVHVRAQRLQVSQAALQAGQFDTKRGAVTGEFIGSFTIERFLDPNSDGLVKDNGSGVLIPASENDTDAFLGPYKFRVLNTRQLSL